MLPYTVVSTEVSDVELAGVSERLGASPDVSRCDEDDDAGVAPVEEGFSSSLSCTDRLSNSLRAFRNVDLSIDQSDGKYGVGSSELDRDVVRPVLDSAAAAVVSSIGLI